MVEEWKKTENLYFDSDASILKRVGRESISNPIVAIVELIKNSYDADAENVKIIFENIKHGKGKIKVIDDGEGMDIGDLSKKWKTLSIPDKELNPLTKSKKRVKIGEKGIGRMGLEGLSKNLKIISKAVSSDKTFKLEINWGDYTSGTPLNKIPNFSYESPKKRNEHGFEIELDDLSERWDEDKIKTLKEQVSLITPLGVTLDFNVEIVCKDYPEYEGKIEVKFLQKSIFHFKAQLNEKGEANYWMKHRIGKTYNLPEKGLKFSCGPVYFEFFFFYREQSKYPEDEIDISKIKDVLDSYGGIKLYRDNFLVRLQRADWLGLDEMRVQEPAIIPSTNQVFGFVKIGKIENPMIKDTTNREGLIENTPYSDMKEFLKKAINAFKVFRKQAEYHDGERKKIPLEEQLKEAVKKTKTPRVKKLQTKSSEVFLDFSKKYPYSFYKKLEDEINQCKESSLPNATLVLCRKIVENLVYNVLHLKFPNEINLRFSTQWGKPLAFHALLNNLEFKLKSKGFDGEQEKLLKKALSLIYLFLKDANSTAHNLIDYLDDISELERLKIPEIVQLLLILIEDIKLKNSA